MQDVNDFAHVYVASYNDRPALLTSKCMPLGSFCSISLAIRLISSLSLTSPGSLYENRVSIIEDERNACCRDLRNDLAWALVVRLDDSF